MFGPGLESSTSGIARKILEDTTGVFTVKGMFPGMSEGKHKLILIYLNELFRIIHYIVFMLDEVCNFA
jgi:hypothetical protein